MTQPLLRAQRAVFVTLTDRLVADYADRLPVSVVLAHVAEAFDELHAAGVRAGIFFAAESMARRRLDAALDRLAVAG